jgi:hypothetical protein
MKTIVRCECEAVYEQTQAETGYWVEDTADCKVRLRAWRVARQQGAVVRSCQESH